MSEQDFYDPAGGMDDGTGDLDYDAGYGVPDTFDESLRIPEAPAEYDPFDQYSVEELVRQQVQAELAPYMPTEQADQWWTDYQERVQNEQLAEYNQAITKAHQEAENLIDEAARLEYGRNPVTDRTNLERGNAIFGEAEAALAKAYAELEAAGYSREDMNHRHGAEIAIQTAVEAVRNGAITNRLLGRVSHPFSGAVGYRDHLGQIHYSDGSIER